MASTDVSTGVKLLKLSLSDSMTSASATLETDSSSRLPVSLEPSTFVSSIPRLLSDSASASSTPLSASPDSAASAVSRDSSA